MTIKPLTEDEAKEKICPFSLPGHVPLQCQGAQCMSWEWNPERYREFWIADHPVALRGYLANGWEIIDHRTLRSGPNSSEQVQLRHPDSRKGHCALLHRNFPNA